LPSEGAHHECVCAMITVLCACQIKYICTCLCLFVCTQECINLSAYVCIYFNIRPACLFGHAYSRAYICMKMYVSRVLSLSRTVTRTHFSPIALSLYLALAIFLPLSFSFSLSLSLLFSLSLTHTHAQTYKYRHTNTIYSKKSHLRLTTP